MSIDDALVSFVVPSYNYGDYLEECVESIANQRHTDGRPVRKELIIADNMSTDGSLALAHRLAERYSAYFERVEVISATTGQGVNHALNAAIPLTRGEVYMRVDPDDRLKEHHASVSMHHLLNAPDDVSHVYTHTRKMNKDGIVGERVHTHPYVPALLPWKSFTPSCATTRGELMRQMIRERPLDPNRRKHDKPEVFLRLYLMGYRGLMIEDERMELEYRAHGENQSGFGEKVDLWLDRHWKVPDCPEKQALLERMYPMPPSMIPPLVRRHMNTL